MPDLSISLGGDISAFERAMNAALTLGKQRADQLTTVFRDAAVRIDKQWGTALATVKTIDNAITGLKIAGGVFLGFEVLKHVLDVTRQAAEDAAKELQRLVDIGNKARDAGVGTTFFQGFVGQAKQLGLEASQLEAILTQARDSFRSNIGEGDNAASSAVADRVKQNVMAGNLPASANTSLASADTLEQKYRVALDLLTELQNKGALLAEYDLANKMFGPNFENALRNGVDIIGQMRASLDGVATTSEGRIASEQEIATAQRLQAEYAEQDRQVAAAWAPIEERIAEWKQGQLQSMADLRGYYEDVIAAAGRWASALAGIDKYMTDLGNASIFRKFDDLLNKYGLLDKDVARQLDQGHADPDPNAAPPLTVRRRPDTSRSLPSLTPTSAASPAKKQADEVENLIKSLQKAAAAEQGEAAALGLSNKAKQESIDIAKAEEAARERGRALTEAERQQITGLADSYAAAKQRIDDYAKAQEALKQGMDEVREAAKGVLSGFIDDLKNGKGNGQAFADVLTSIESKVLSLAENSVIDALLGKSGTTGTGANSGAAGGLLGTLVSGLGGSFQGWMPHFADGGWVGGPGGGTTDSVFAMLSHGERVIPARAAAANADLLNAIASGKPLNFAPPDAVRRGSGTGQSGYVDNRASVTMHVHTADAPSFARSEGQISALLARAVGRGQRNQ